MSKAEFARLAKVSKPAVSIALRKGRITAERDGSMNPQRPENAAYLTTRKRQRRQSSPGPGGGKRAPAKQKPSRSERRRKPTKGKPRQHIARSAGGRKKQRAQIAESGPQKGALQIDGETFHMADLRHTIAKANKAEQEIAIRRGELVERRDVHNFMARLYQVHASQLKTYAEKIGPDVAAAFKLTDAETPRIQEIAGTDMLRVLSQIKREMNDYLESIGNEELEDRPKPKTKPVARKRKKPRAREAKQ